MVLDAISHGFQLWQESATVARKRNTTEIITAYSSGIINSKPAIITPSRTLIPEGVMIAGLQCS